MLIEPNTVEKLRNMLQEDCWSPGVKRIFGKRLGGECQQHNKFHALPGKVLVHRIRAAGGKSENERLSGVLPILPEHERIITALLGEPRQQQNRGAVNNRI